MQRAYSIASSPKEKEYLEFIIVRVPDGQLTPHLWALQVGDRLWASDKAKGNFTIEGIPPDRDLVMVSTGAGIAPYMSILLESYRGYRLARKRLLNDIDLTDSCRDPLAEFSEVLVARLLQGELASSRVQPGYDVVRNDGRKVQVKYLANPTGKWRNEHTIKFEQGVDEYVLVLFEDLEPKSVLVFSQDHLSEVCEKLGKRHPDQDSTLQLTQRNYEMLISNRSAFETLGCLSHLL